MSFPTSKSFKSTASLNGITPVHLLHTEFGDESCSTRKFTQARAEIAKKCKNPNDPQEVKKKIKEAKEAALNRLSDIAKHPSDYAPSVREDPSWNVNQVQNKYTILLTLKIVQENMNNAGKPVFKDFDHYNDELREAGRQLGRRNLQINRELLDYLLSYEKAAFEMIALHENTPWWVDPDVKYSLYKTCYTDSANALRYSASQGEFYRKETLLDFEDKKGIDLAFKTLKSSDKNKQNAAKKRLIEAFGSPNHKFAAYITRKFLFARDHKDLTKFSLDLKAVQDLGTDPLSKQLLECLRSFCLTYGKPNTDLSDLKLPADFRSHAEKVFNFVNGILINGIINQ